MSLPQSNAVVTRIRAAGASEDWDYSSGEGASRFYGEVDAYVQDDVLTTFTSGEGALRKVKNVRLILPADLDTNGPIVSGDVVTFEYMGVTHKMRVQEVNSKVLAGIPNLTMKLHMESQPVEA